MGEQSHETGDMIFVKISNFKWIKCVYRVLIVLILLPNFNSCNTCNEQIGITTFVRCCFFMSVLVPYVKLSEMDKLVTIPQAVEGFSFVEDPDAPISQETLTDTRMNQFVALVAHTGREPAGGNFFRGGEIITIGIVIDHDHVLTSYNPFRTVRKEIGLSSLTAYFYAGVWDYQETFSGYLLETEDFSCARQVMPMHESDITEEQWHGPDHIHSPVHDLMVLKTAKNLTDLPDDKEKPNWGNLSISVTYKIANVSELATPNHFLSDQLIYITLAFFEKGNGRVRNYLRLVDTYGHGRVVLDCDEWFIRDWGHFICIKNTEEDVERLGSGAFLISEGRVFGVGSFYLKKGKDSIVVFTDVRPYHHLIVKTCSELDGNE